MPKQLPEEFAVELEAARATEQELARLTQDMARRTSEMAGKVATALSRGDYVTAVEAARITADGARKVNRAARTLKDLFADMRILRAMADGQRLGQAP